MHHKDTNHSTIMTIFCCVEFALVGLPYYYYYYFVALWFCNDNWLAIYAEIAECDVLCIIIYAYSY